MKKISLIIAFSVFFLARMNAQIIPEGVYYIRSSINRNYVIDLNASVVQSGNNIQLWDFNGTNAQKWRVTHSNGAVVLRSAINNSFVIDLNSSNASNGANIQLWEYNGTNAQRWYAEKRGAFYVLHSAVNSHFNLDLKQSNTARGANIHLWEDNNTGAQKWIFEPVSASTASSSTAGSVNTTNGTSNMSGQTTDAGAVSFTVATHTTVRNDSVLAMHHNSPGSFEIKTSATGEKYLEFLVTFDPTTHHASCAWFKKTFNSRFMRCEVRHESKDVEKGVYVLTYKERCLIFFPESAERVIIYDLNPNNVTTEYYDIYKVYGKNLYSNIIHMITSAYDCGAIRATGCDGYLDHISFKSSKPKKE